MNEKQKGTLEELLSNIDGIYKPMYEELAEYAIGLTTDESRTIILSLQPDPYNRIIAGAKKYEYRRRFVSGPVNAFIYVSSPIQEIRGYIEFGQPIYDKVSIIAELAEKEKSGGAIKIYHYMKNLEKGYAIPILSFQEIQPISLSELSEKYKFTAPQSYLNIETLPDLKNILLHR